MSSDHGEALHLMHSCPTEKIRYNDIRAAERRCDAEPVPLRTYYCPACKGYHVTKKRAKP